MIINDAVSKTAIFAAVEIANMPGIGIAGGTNFLDPTNYPVFVPADFRSPLTLHVRRHANGDAEIVDINGVAPNPRALLAAAAVPIRNRAPASVEFGSASPEAQANVTFTRFEAHSSLVAAIPLALSLSRVRLFPNEHGRVEVEGDFTLDGASDGIDLVAEKVAVRILRDGTRVYPVGADFMPVEMETILGGWRITKAEKERTGIENFRILQTGDPSFFVFRLRDTRTGLPEGDYSQVEIELVIGDDAVSATANLIERRGNWFLPRH